MRVSQGLRLFLLAGWMAAAAVAGAAEVDRRLPVPDAATLAKAQSTVNELFHSELSDHSTAGQASAAGKLLAAARETNDDPVGVYVLLKNARDLALTAGAIDTAVAASEQTATVYAVDGAKLRLSTLTRLAAKLSKPPEFEALARAAASTAEGLAGEEEWDAAAQAANVAESSAATSKIADALAGIKLRMDAVRKAIAEGGRIRAARAALAKNPNDGEASRTVGIYLCITKRDWKDGIATLTHVNDPALRALAAQDATAPAAPDARLQLADAWWDYASSQGDQLKLVGEARAANWYQLSAGSLPLLRKLQVEKRLKVAAADLSAVAAPTESPALREARAHEARARIDSAETVAYPPAEVTEDTAVAPSARPFRIDGTLKVSATLTFDAGVEIRGGKIDLGRKGHLKINGMAEKPVIFRHVEIIQDLGASVAAQFSDFDECVFRKGGVWYDHFSSKWQFNHCILYKCNFPRLTGVDYGFEILNCALVSMNFPDIDQGANTVSRLRASWNRIVFCDFVDCTVPSTIFWCGEQCNFRGCKFPAGKSFSVGSPLTVEAFVTESAGTAPEEAWDVDQRDKVTFRNATVPFPTLELPRATAIPEVEGGAEIRVAVSQFR